MQRPCRFKANYYRYPNYIYQLDLGCHLVIMLTYLSLALSMFRNTTEHKRGKCMKKLQIRECEHSSRLFPLLFQCYSFSFESFLKRSRWAVYTASLLSVALIQVTLWPSFFNNYICRKITAFKNIVMH